MKHMYMARIYVMAETALEALTLAKDEAIAEVLRVEETKPEVVTKSAVGFVAIEPEVPYIPYDN